MVEEKCREFCEISQKQIDFFFDWSLKEFVNYYNQLRKRNREFRQIITQKQMANFVSRLWKKSHKF